MKDSFSFVSSFALAGSVVWYQKMQEMKQRVRLIKVSDLHDYCFALHNFFS